MLLLSDGSIPVDKRSVMKAAANALLQIPTAIPDRKCTVADSNLEE